MNPFHRDIRQQATALRDFAASQRASAAANQVTTFRPHRVVLTGMGASFHAALWGSHVLHSLGVWAIAVESSELLQFGSMVLEGADAIVVISQSGASAEVVPLLDRVPAGMHVFGVTNNPQSPLARRAATHLHIAAGAETTVACKTYLNTLACLWLATHRWVGKDPEQALAQIETVATGVEALIADADAIGTAWCDRLLTADKVVFVGHGPYVPTARQGAMMMGEWLKRQATGTGIGSFRHGLIEFTDAMTGVVVLGAGGSTGASVALLGSELRSYGATVLGVVEGRLAGTDTGEARALPELLSAMLDVVPMQIFVEAAARRLNIDPTFRHITKVIASI